MKIITQTNFVVYHYCFYEKISIPSYVKDGIF